MESKLDVLLERTEHIQKDVGEIKRDVRECFTNINTTVERVAKVEGKQGYAWLLISGVWLAILGLGAKAIFF